MKKQEWARFSENNELGVGLLHAYYVRHAYPRHSHDYYVISLIEQGCQSFTHKGTKYLTPAGGLIFINPEAVHTGEPADARGFELRSLYPSIQLMQAAVLELTGRRGLPSFREVRVDHPWAKDSVLSLHHAILEGAGPLECESRLLLTLTGLIKRYADILDNALRPRGGKTIIRKAQSYIDEYFQKGVSLNELAGYVGLSPYYLLRAFQAEVGMPPYAYLESVRIRHAQGLIRRGRSLAEVAAETGFSSQSHMTHRFRRIIGATPGQYAAQVSGA
jgi:AraC-like DNA-binding protein